MNEACPAAPLLVLAALPGACSRGRQLCAGSWQKTWASAPAKEEVFSPKLVLAVFSLTGNGIEVLRYLVFPTYWAYSFQDFLELREYSLLIVMCALANDFWLSEPAGRVLVGADSFLSPVHIKPSTEGWLGTNRRWNKVSHQFVPALLVWVGYLPTQVTILCRSPESGNCRRDWIGK